MLKNHFAVTLPRQTPTPQSLAVEFLYRLGELVVLDEIPTEPALIQRNRPLPRFDLATVLDEFEWIPKLGASVNPAGRLESAPRNKFRAAGFMDDASATIGLGNVEITTDPGADCSEWIFGRIGMLTHRRLPP
jgi:hypothetical protein